MTAPGSSPAADLAHALVAAVGPDHVLTASDVLASYETDWTRRFAGRALAAVRPASAAEVGEVLVACARAGVRVVVQGGNTGLVGGSVPAGGEVVLSTTRLRRLDPVDGVAGHVTAGAGVPLAHVQRAARDAGWEYGVDLAARETATVGGTIATNAGGLHVVRHGDTRRQVLGVEAVLADGSVVSRLEALPKDNTGYDLAGLLTGSEGTLGVITAARLRLVPRSEPGEVLLVGCPTVEYALRLLPRSGVRAAELMLAAGVDLVRRVTGLPRPLEREWPAYLLLELDGDALPHLPDSVDAAMDRRLWAYRERHTDAISSLGVPHKLDVAVPLARLAEFVAVLPAVTAPHEVFVFGHLAEGNLHVNVVGPEPSDETVDEAVLRLVAGLGGSISAEHGIGRAKAQWLSLTRSSEEIAAMRRIKAAFDPAVVLNPGVLLG